jgi:selenide,water dikinase
MPKRLTEYADCAGCASKLDAGLLAELTVDLPISDDPRVLVDFRTSDDAGVYRWGNGSALVQTVDFFTPIVDDPYDFGQIAAANALSDVYAMGGQPRTALAVTTLPKNGPSAEVIREVFRGGSDKLREAGVALLGGHTVSDQEIKFGYAVTGAIDEARVLTNAGARVGDRLILTKPLGTGILATAGKFQRASETQLAGAIASMVRLNRDAARAAAALPRGAVSACTDITGFGLVGHGSGMAAASSVTLAFDAASLPVLDGALDLAIGNLPGGGRTNEEHFGSGVSVGPGIEEPLWRVAFDPQTSGGLLLAVSPEAEPALLDGLRRAGIEPARVGVVEAPQAGVRVRLA